MFNRSPEHHQVVGASLSRVLSRTCGTAPIEVAFSTRAAESRRARRRSPEARLRGLTAAQQQVDRVAHLLDSFDTIWDALVPQEQRELLQLLVEGIVVDLDAGGFRIVFHEVRVAPTHPPAAVPSAEEVRA